MEAYNNEIVHRYHLFSNEPYTSELYSGLLEPAFNQVRESYVAKGLAVVPKHRLINSLVTSSLKGAAIGAIKAMSMSAILNMNKDYDNHPDPKPPVDLYFLKYYTNPKRYPDMFRGVKPNMAIEMIFQAALKAVNTYSMFLVSPQNLEFHTTLGVSIARSFTSNFIASTTVYPLALFAFKYRDPEEVLKYTLRRAGVGSLTASLRTAGISVARSLLPSYKDMVTIALEIIA